MYYTTQSVLSWLKRIAGDVVLEDALRSTCEQHCRSVVLLRNGKRNIALLQCVCVDCFYECFSSYVIELMSPLFSVCSREYCTL